MVFTTGAHGNLSLAVGRGEAATRARVLAGLGLDLSATVFMEQVHGAGVRRVGTADRGRGALDPATAVPGADALVTTAPGVVLAVLAADCVPLLLAAPGAGVAAVHAGRRGVVAGVVPAAVEALAVAAGGQPRDLVATIGPAIGGCCYEVPRGLALEVTSAVPAARARAAWGSPSLDLPAAVTAQLGEAGVERLSAVGGCTRCDAGRYFSHRAAAAAGVAPGRQAGFVVRRAALPRSAGEASLD